MSPAVLVVVHTALPIGGGFILAYLHKIIPLPKRPSLILGPLLLFMVLNIFSLPKALTTGPYKLKSNSSLNLSAISKDDRHTMIKHDAHVLYTLRKIINGATVYYFDKPSINLSWLKSMASVSSVVKLPPSQHRLINKPQECASVQVFSLRNDEKLQLCIPVNQHESYVLYREAHNTQLYTLKPYKKPLK